MPLYYTEWQAAHRMGDEFFLYVVNRALKNSDLWIARDPVGKGIRSTEKVVEYHIDLAQLRVAAESGGAP